MPPPRSTLRLLLLVLLALAIVAFLFKAVLFEPLPEPSPVALPPPRAAKIESMEGEVGVKRMGTVDAFPQARVGQWLSNGDRLKTGPRALARLVFVDGAALDVRPDSLIVIEAGLQNRAREALDVKSGGVQYQGPGREVWTPTGRWFPAGGAQPVLVIRVAKDGVTEIQQTAGTGTLRTNAGQMIALREGSGVSVDAAGKTEGAHTLLEAPVLLAPPDAAEVTFLDPSHATTVMLWKEVPGAASYRLTLDESAFFPAPQVDRTRIAGTSVEIEGLAVGRYYWRVAALDAQGHEGVPAAFFRFQVRSAKPGGNRVALLLEVLELRGNVLQVRGRTAPGATVMLAGQRLTVDETGAFGEFVTLAETGPQSITVQATKPGTEPTEVKRQVGGS